MPTRCGTQDILALLHDMNIRIGVVDDYLIQAVSSDGKLLFDVNHPVTVDSVDVLPTVKVVADEPWLIVVDVYSHDSNSPAGAFCRRLASVTSGAMVHLGTGEVWPKQYGAAVATAPASAPARGLSISWFGFLDDDHLVLPRVFVEQAQRCFGKPLVRRYGPVEPLEFRFSAGGVDAMTEVWSQAQSSILFSCSLKSFEYGSMTTPDGAVESSLMWRATLDGCADHFVDESMRDQLRALFTGFADSSHALYAFAEVDGGYYWDGSHCLGSIGTAERHPSVWVHRRMPFQRVTGLMGLTP